MQRILQAFTLLLLASLAPAAQLQRSGHDQASLERWRQLSPAQRADLRTRFEAFQRMDESERAELRARFERLREAEQRVQRELAPELQAQAEGLPPQARREFLREHLTAEFSRCGKRVGELLPPELRRRLESATPEERMQLMQELRGHCEGDKLARGLQELGRRLEFSATELAELEALEPEARRAKLLELRRREVVERVEREGTPEWIGDQEWRAWRGLDDREFCRRLHARRGDEHGGGRGDEAGETWRLLRPDPSWLEELAELAEPARRAELDRRLGARLLDFFAANPERLPPGELERLRALPATEVPAAVRERLRAARAEHRGPARERGGPPD